MKRARLQVVLLWLIAASTMLAYAERTREPLLLSLLSLFPMAVSALTFRVLLAQSKNWIAPSAERGKLLAVIVLFFLGFESAFFIGIAAGRSSTSANERQTKAMHVAYSR